MFCEHVVLNHSNVLYLYCFGRLTWPLELDTLEEGVEQKNGR